MSRDVLRLSQIVGTFGPGAMIDLPDRSVIVSGLDHWEMHRPNAIRLIEERRLVELLEERLRGDRRIAQGKKLSLRSPPIDPGLLSSGTAPTVPVMVFPTFFTCDTVEAPTGGGDEGAAEAITAGAARRRRIVEWSKLEPPQRKKYRDDGGKAHEVSPLRFVCGCENGHLQDIPWRWVVHGEEAPGTRCNKPLWLEETGTSGDPRDTRVVCGCSKSLRLEELFQPGRLGFCKGERPWIGDRDPIACTDESNQPTKLRLLTRSATNAYFPQAATVISLPEAADELGRVVAQFMTELRHVTSAAEVGFARKVNQAIGASLAPYSDAEVFARIRQLEAGTVAATAPDPRVAEYETLASGQVLIGEDAPDARLHANTLPRAAWDPDNDPLLSALGDLVAVHRLREVVCLYGFTRFESSPTMSDAGLDEVGLAVRGAPLGTDPDWLPAILQFGEGLFLTLKPDAVAAWLQGTDAKAHADRLATAFQVWEMERHVPARSIAYTLLHSLSHALMSEIALDCGYPASALKERIYSLPPAMPGGSIRCGLLIYTATAGTQGTLGGLVEVAGRIGPILHAAFRRLGVCSSDPVCSDHDPTSTKDDRATHGAACHGCLLIAETSCEMRNLFLDRALLVDTMAERRASFFPPP
jgi:hypothetical protein